jgi:hypothetical protein
MYVLYSSSYYCMCPGTVYVCPHTTIYWCYALAAIDLILLYMCRHTTIYSSILYIDVKYHLGFTITATCALILLYVSSYYYICSSMRTHTHVVYYICSSMRTHTHVVVFTTPKYYVSLYYCICSSIYYYICSSMRTHTHVVVFTTHKYYMCPYTTAYVVVWGHYCICSSMRTHSIVPSGCFISSVLILLILLHI